MRGLDIVENDGLGCDNGSLVESYFVVRVDLPVEWLAGLAQEGDSQKEDEQQS